ncbi:MAG: hypothetical protein ACRCUX_10065 [Beijerinckiaceae bacterium]
MTVTLLLLAAALIMAIGVAHSWLGETKLIGPLTAPATRSGLLAQSRLARKVLRFAWHVTTVAWLGLATVLAWLAVRPFDGSGRGVIVIIAVTFLVTAVACMAGGRRHWAWLVFLLIAGLTVAAAV